MLPFLVLDLEYVHKRKRAERQFFLIQVSGKNMQATTAASYAAKTERPVHTVMLF